MSEARILVVGSTMMDLIAYAQRLPEVGETLVGDRFQMGFGGKGANQAVMAEVYAEAVTRRVYDRLAGLAGTVLDAGCSVVVDAACTKRWQRDLLAGTAGDRGMPVIWVAFDLPASALVARVAGRQARGDDPSDASAEIVMQQVADVEPLAVEEVRSDGTLVRVTAGDTDIGPEGIAKRVVEMIG
jgi:predicted kinase